MVDALHQIFVNAQEIMKEQVALLARPIRAMVFPFPTQQVSVLDTVSV